MPIYALFLVMIMMFSQFAYAESSNEFTITAKNSAPDSAAIPIASSTSNGGFGSAPPMVSPASPMAGGFDGEFGREFKEMPQETMGVSAMARPAVRNTAEGMYNFGEKPEFSTTPNFGPSYEGFDKDAMMFAKLFSYIEGEINNFESIDYCSAPEKMADAIIAKVKGKIGEISNVCAEMERHEEGCKEKTAKSCSMMGQPDTSYAVDDQHKYEILSGSCPVNKEAIHQACVLRLKQNIEDKTQFTKQNCENQWENYGSQNQAQCESAGLQMECNEDSYIKSCLERYGVREGEIICPNAPQKPQCENGMLKEKHDANNCLTAFECVPNIVTPSVCHMTAEDIQRQSNECIAKKGTPEKVLENNCVTSVKCAIPPCPYTEEQLRQKEANCIASNGKLETVKEGDCVTAVECRPIATDSANSSGGEGGSVTGQVIASSAYEDYKSKCHREWSYQKQNCEQIKKQCRGRDAFIDECVTREKGFAEKEMVNAKRQCEMDSLVQIRHMERQCAKMGAERQRCLDEGTKRCETMQGLGGQCREKMTEENFRGFMIKEAEKKCRFKDYVKKKDFSKYDKMEVVIAVVDTAAEEDISKIKSIVEGLQKKYEIDGKIIYEGDMDPNSFGELKNLNFIVDAKLNAPESSETAKTTKESIISELDPGKVVEKLLALRDSDVSSEYKYIIEDKANDILKASESINNVQESEESRGFGYKLKLFLGFAKDAEESEIKSLELSMQRLETSIKSLGKLSEEIPNEISKSILKEQVAELERQKEDIDGLIKQKEKKSNGLLRLFGLLG